MKGILNENRVFISEARIWYQYGEVNTDIYKSRPQWPKISIITPSYNQGSFIEDTIKSIINQNYPNLEYIIIDGGSTDGTIEIIRKYESKISFWVSEKDSGQTEAINKGIKKCTGEIFNWVNSDDYLEPNALFIVANNFINGADVICAMSNVISHPSNKLISEAGTSIYQNIAKTISWVKNHQPATFYNLQHVKEIFPLSQNLHYTMDQELWIKYLFKFGQSRIKAIKNTIVNFRIHNYSKTGSDSMINFLGLPYLFFKDYNSLFYSIALEIGETQKSSVIKSMLNNKDTPIEIKFQFKETVELAVETLNYYLFRLLVDEYIKGNIFECRLLIGEINSKAFEKTDKKGFRSIKFRTYLYPIIKFLKKTIKKK